MTRMILLWLSAVVVLAACARSPAAPGPTPGTGVTGTVMAGPQCPVQQQPAGSQPAPASSPPCAERPVQADIRVTEVRSGRVVTTVRSATDGRFRINLPPGQYELEALNPGNGSAAGPPLLVTVGPDAPAETTLRFDTGIR